MERRVDYFVSHAGADRAWAEWIANELLDLGRTVKLDIWDWGAGSNFILEMDRASTMAEHTLVLLSPSFLEGVYTQPEWAAALAADPDGSLRRLIPVRVALCDIKGLLRSIVYVDLVGLDETQARVTLREGLDQTRPTSRPPFPGVP